MEEKTVYKFSRKKDEEIQFTLREYKGNGYLDLRVFFKPKESGRMLPTRKGITLGINSLQDLKKGIFACEKELNNRPPVEQPS